MREMSTGTFTNVLRTRHKHKPGADLGAQRATCARAAYCSTAGFVRSELFVRSGQPAHRKPFAVIT